MKLKITLGLFLFFLLAGITEVWATHIRAGEIIAERVNVQTLEYEITVVGYTDTRSSVIFGPGIINFGDGRETELQTESDFKLVEDLGNLIEKNTYVIRHVFQGPGTYTIRFQEFNRNDRTLNMDNSVDTPFYVETTITIDPFYGVNNSPVLTIPPVDNGAVNVRYIHNPGAYDPDGDSLAYEMDIPKQAFERPVNNYRSPADDEFSFSQEDGSTPAFLTLDPVTGDLVWDAPGTAGQFNVAFRIKEYRKINGEWELIGWVVRDMQIIIENSNNRRPELILPPDLCVEAGTLIEEVIQGQDPDGDPIKIEVFGEPVEITTSPGSYSPEAEYQPTPGIVNFNWQTVCNHVRAREYEVRVRITDQPSSGPALVDIKTWRIKVVGPPPVFNEIEQMPGRSVELNWDPYVCGNSASEMQVWRRINSDPYEPDSCETGIRAGYELIGTTDLQTFDFLDENGGAGLAPGNTYCYRLVAAFPEPRLGESIVSQEICVTIDVDVPIITNVSIEETDTEDGEIFIKWTPPYDIDQVQFPGPYTYELLRSTGFTGNSDQVSLGVTSDTLFTDTGLNTDALVYNYDVVLLDRNTKIDTSSKASSVWLEPTIINEAIELNWDFTVPWNNSISQYKHEVYRNRTDADAADEDNFVLIAEVDVTQDGFTFLDDGSFNGVPLEKEVSYCYYVITKGAYNVDGLEYPLENKSQIVCAKPDDNRLPCPPVLTFEGPMCEEYLAGMPCNTNSFEHELSWTPDFSGECDDELSGYKLYYTSDGEEGQFELIAELSSLELSTTITDLTTYRGCYYITAIDRSGNESEPSNIVCVENCPNYNLPNAFTPNGDGTNDTFMAFDNPFAQCPRFVTGVEIFIVNRWGVEVFSYNSLESAENDVYIRWDGRDKNGNELPAGTYYYSGSVSFDVLDPAQQQESLKGTIQILK
ncbi:gliding motility-associated C-terminal domain-containing protein [Algoriphagus halophytocola]|uniref:Gliding motility-associated C-terminal domain-containing protein n=1 Tax=Algoriphagus halophytocola TaxID=2991499 RepID=A0ABY6MPY6_9BACT|nr:MULTISPECIES: gliding motility-associated C-terminal domain-containing protein [unclassified Algoriphagus]UZD24611.1 gliding motility-associated C-terminal domain-containing protein [Algoriphagus sp. TR-M5]WBL41979.1 gliding motility-associated C-terminal domain-containing protein [Algoriphagus sp. TR-M9]